MDITARLEQLWERIAQRATEAVLQRDVAGLTRWRDAAEEFDLLLKETQSLEKKVLAFELAIENPSQPAATPVPVLSNKVVELPERLSPKTMGSLIRTEWIEQLGNTHGIELVGHGKRYRTKSDVSIGIAFANELPNMPNRWFLGLPDERVDIVSLLCQSKDRQVYDIVLPVTELGPKWDDLSRSKGQLKFNIRKDGSNFFLLVPRNEPIIVTKHVGNYDPLR
jgi:hypothetical protein